MKTCQCEKPTPWEDNKGIKTNVCKMCNGKIEEHILPELGRLHTALDAVLLGELRLDSDDPFITWLADQISTDIKQKKTTWDYNRLVGIP